VVKDEHPEQRMPWSNQRPRRARYDWNHQKQRARHMAALRAAGSGSCAERICVKTSRLITPDMDLHLCHDRSTGRIRGLGHAPCNLAEAARYARAQQTTTSGEAMDLVL
jgi:hypothetical protein